MSFTKMFKYKKKKSNESLHNMKLWLKTFQSISVDLENINNIMLRERRRFNHFAQQISNTTNYLKTFYFSRESSNIDILANEILMHTLSNAYHVAFFELIDDETKSQSIHLC